MGDYGSVFLWKSEGQLHLEQSRASFFLQKGPSCKTFPRNILQFTPENAPFRFGVFRPWRWAIGGFSPPKPLATFYKRWTKILSSRGNKYKFLCCYLANLKADAVCRTLFFILLHLLIAAIRRNAVELWVLPLLFQQRFTTAGAFLHGGLVPRNKIAVGILAASIEHTAPLCLFQHYFSAALGALRTRLVDNLFDIFHAAHLKEPAFYRQDPFIVGIASGYEEAMEMVRCMVEDIYRETGAFRVREYFGQTGQES